MKFYILFFLTFSSLSYSCEEELRYLVDNHDSSLMSRYHEFSNFRNFEERSVLHQNLDFESPIIKLMNQKKNDRYVFNFQDKIYTYTNIFKKEIFQSNYSVDSIELNFKDQKLVETYNSGLTKYLIKEFSNLVQIYEHKNENKTLVDKASVVISEMNKEFYSNQKIFEDFVHNLTKAFRYNSGLFRELKMNSLMYIAERSRLVDEHLRVIRKNINLLETKVLNDELDALGLTYKFNRDVLEKLNGSKVFNRTDKKLITNYIYKKMFSIFEAHMDSEIFKINSNFLSSNTLKKKKIRANHLKKTLNKANDISVTSELVTIILEGKSSKNTSFTKKIINKISATSGKFIKISHRSGSKYFKE